MADGELTWHQDPHTTKTVLPAGAADCHFHIFGPQDIFPYREDSSFKPADAPKEALFSLHAQMGIERGVMVQANCHGFDNSAIADAIAAKPDSYRGVALAPPEVSDKHLEKLDSQGFRALRFNYMAHLPPLADKSQLPKIAARLAGIDWHLLIHMDNSLIAEFAPVLAQLPVPVVIDHFGRIDASRGPEQPEFDALLSLLDHDHIWCKVSGVERASRQDPPYADAIPFARRIVAHIPDRVLWGTDWPHPNFRAAPPDDGDLFDLLPEIAPTPDLMQALMVDNPMRLYRFGETTR